METELGGTSPASLKQILNLRVMVGKSTMAALRLLCAGCARWDGQQRACSSV